MQCGQPALHVADALGEAGLLALEHLLQLADGREELLFVETVLGSPRRGAGEQQQQQQQQERAQRPADGLHSWHSFSQPQAGTQAWKLPLG